VLAAAHALSLDTINTGFRTEEDIASAIEPLNGRAEALYVCNDPLVNAKVARINAAALAARSMRFSAKSCAYSDMPSLSSHSAICCIAPHLSDDTGDRAKISEERSVVNSLPRFGAAFALAPLKHLGGGGKDVVSRSGSPNALKFKLTYRLDRTASLTAISTRGLIRI
jgi:hypothetical protein